MFIKKVILSLSILLISICGVQANFVDKSSQKIKASSGNIEINSFNIMDLDETDEVIASNSILYIEEIPEDEVKIPDTFQDDRNIMMISTMSELH